MSKIINIDDFRPHQSGEAKCLECNHSWIAIAPIGVVELECPECETKKGVWLGVCAPNENEYFFECKCGNDLFFITPDSVKCCKCGTRHNP